MSSSKHSADIAGIVNNLDRYISQHEAHQLGLLKRLAILSEQLNGFDNTIETYSNNIELFQSFFTVKSELSILQEQLVESEMAAIAQASHQPTCVDEPKSTTPLAELDTIDYSRDVCVPDQQHVVRFELADNRIQQIEQHTVTTVEAPNFIETISDATVQAGENCVFACRFTGSQPITVNWLKDDIPITNYQHYNVHYEKDRCSLTISEAFTGDAATFTCHISNYYGAAKTSAQLTIQHTTMVEQYAETLFPPHFTRPLANCTTEAGASVCWSCFVEGNPLPTIQWFKNDQCVDVDPRYDISFNNGESILRLNALSADDAGHYTIVAKNRLGIDQCLAKLTVLAPPSSPAPPTPPPVPPKPIAIHPMNGKVLLNILLLPTKELDR